MSAFTFCWLPFFVLALVRPFLETTNTLKTVGSLFLWLGYSNSLFNPVIYATLNRDFRKPFQAILYFRCGSLNNMMREEFYHSQYGDPDQHFNRCHIDYDEGVEYIEAEGEEIKAPELNTAHESFLWFLTLSEAVVDSSAYTVYASSSLCSLAWFDRLRYSNIPEKSLITTNLHFGWKKRRSIISKLTILFDSLSYKRWFSLWKDMHKLSILYDNMKALNSIITLFVHLIGIIIINLSTAEQVKYEISLKDIF